MGILLSSSVFFAIHFYFPQQVILWYKLIYIHHYHVSPVILLPLFHFLPACPLFLHYTKKLARWRDFFDRLTAASDIRLRRCGRVDRIRTCDLRSRSYVAVHESSVFWQAFMHDAQNMAVGKTALNRCGAMVQSCFLCCGENSSQIVV